jgi:hypothetical protein
MNLNKRSFDEIERFPRASAPLKLLTSLISGLSGSSSASPCTAATAEGATPMAPQKNQPWITRIDPNRGPLKGTFSGGRANRKSFMIRECGPLLGAYSQQVTPS